MANDLHFIDYVCDQIGDECEVSYRHTFNSFAVTGISMVFDGSRGDGAITGDCKL